MDRKNIPDAPRVVGGILGKDEILPTTFKHKKWCVPVPSSHSLQQSEGPESSPSSQFLLPRMLLEPPTLSYQDRNLSANGL